MSHEPNDQRLCHAKRKHIAQGDIGYKSKRLPDTFLMIMEREILICKKTDDTGDEIIGRRRHPIATAQPIIHPKHDAHAQDGVGCANGGKAHQFPIHQVMMQMVHHIGSLLTYTSELCSVHKQYT